MDSLEGSTKLAYSRHFLFRILRLLMSEPWIFPLVTTKMGLIFNKQKIFLLSQVIQDNDKRCILLLVLKENLFQNYLLMALQPNSE
jgi:hypothetical protein